MIDFITELQNLFKRCTFHVVGISKPDSPEFLHFIWMKLNKQQFGSCFKKKDFQFRENLYINKFDFEQTSILIERCVIPHTSTIKRTITAMAPPCLVLPSNITDTSLVEPPCPGKRQFLLYPLHFLLENKGNISPKITLAAGKAMPILLQQRKQLVDFTDGNPCLQKFPHYFLSVCLLS